MVIGQSKLHELVRRRRLLSDSLIWFESFDVQMKNFMIELIRKDQLTDRGVAGDGEVIGYYSLVTSFGNPLKKFNSHYTLDDKGDFYKSIFIQLFSDRVVADANSNSFREMQEQDWYKDDILDWTNESIQKIKEALKPKYIAAVKRVLLGTR